MDTFENNEYTEEPIVEEPIEEEPVAEEPVVDEPVSEEPIFEEPEHTTFEVYTEAPKVQPEPVKAPKPKKEKHPGFWILAILLAVSLILQTMSMIRAGGRPGIDGASINDAGELVLTYSDGSTENLGSVVGKDGNDGSDGVTTVITESENKSVAISNGLRSSVSVFCTFTKETNWGGIGGWGGGKSSTSEYYSAGSGVIYQLDRSAGDAIIITNYHVVYDSDSNSENGIADTITIYLYGSEITGSEMEASYVGGSMYYDLAVLYVEGSEVLKNSDATAVTVADSDAVQVGSTAIAIGNAEGSGISATSGVVSIASEYITMTAADGQTSVDYRVMRIDTAVNSGNSGGGLFDAYGNLIGIVNAKTVDDGVENIGYALPSSAVVAVVNNILDYCFGTDCESVMRPILGVTVQTVGSNAEYDGETGMLNIVETVQIQSVEKDQLGKVFEVGDILVSTTLNGKTKELTRQYQLIDLLITARPGDTVDFVVLRDGEEVTLTVTIDGTCLTAY